MAKRPIDEAGILHQPFDIHISLQFLGERTARVNSISHGWGGPLSRLLLLVYITLDVDYTRAIEVLILLLLLLILLLAHYVNHVVLLLRAYLIERLDPLGGTLDDGVGDCLLHEVDLTLTNELHVSVRERNLELL